MESSQKPDGQRIRRNLILSLLTQMSSAPTSVLMELDTLLKVRRSSSSGMAPGNPNEVRITVSENLGLGERIG